jgi:hypothetical protein
MIETIQVSVLAHYSTILYLFRFMLVYVSRCMHMFLYTMDPRTEE